MGIPVSLRFGSNHTLFHTARKERRKLCGIFARKRVPRADFPDETSCRHVAPVAKGSSPAHAGWPRNAKTGLFPVKNRILAAVAAD